MDPLYVWRVLVLNAVLFDVHLNCLIYKEVAKNKDNRTCFAIYLDYLPGSGFGKLEEEVLTPKVEVDPVDNVCVRDKYPWKMPDLRTCEIIVAEGFREYVVGGISTLIGYTITITITYIWRMIHGAPPVP